MIDLAHKKDMETMGCFCGSQWNYMENGCSSLYPLDEEVMAYHRTLAEEDCDFGYYECRHGHAYCGRH